jgi:hypothetical protein
MLSAPELHADIASYSKALDTPHAVGLQVLEAITAAHKTILAWEANEKLQEWGGDANGHSASAAKIREAAASVRADTARVAVLPRR